MKTIITTTLALTLTLHTVATNLSPIWKEINQGNFSFASQMITEELASNSQLSHEQRDSLVEQQEIMRRIRMDFTKSEQEIKTQLSRYFTSITPDQWSRWIENKQLERMVIDGEEFFFNNAAKNLTRLDAEGKQLRETQEGKERAWRDDLMRLKLPAIMRDASHNSQRQGKPQRMRITYTLTVKANEVPEGTTLRCWLPYPRINARRQKDVRLIAASQDLFTISPAMYAHSTLYMEKKAVANTPTRFAYTAEYSAVPEWFDLSAEKIKPYSGKEIEYCGERAPHILFTDSIRAISKRIVGDATNPYTIASAIYTWISTNFPWASAREYSTIPCIPEYVIANRHGDCGQVTLLFMTLCRYNGIPARWESGWMMHPKHKNLHDWCEIYFEGVGWVPVDQSFGVQRWSSDPQKQLFFLNGTDQYRLIINNDFAQPLFPEKQFMRSETLDFQRGEVESEFGNLYFNQWNYSMNIEYIK